VIRLGKLATRVAAVGKAFRMPGWPEQNITLGAQAASVDMPPAG
jgi:hypothetical protein